MRQGGFPPPKGHPSAASFVSFLHRERWAPAPPSVQRSLDSSSIGRASPGRSQTLRTRWLGPGSLPWDGGDPEIGVDLSGMRTRCPILHCPGHSAPMFLWGAPSPSLSVLTSSVVHAPPTPDHMTPRANQHGPVQSRESHGNWFPTGTCLVGLLMLSRLNPRHSEFWGVKKISFLA